MRGSLIEQMNPSPTHVASAITAPIRREPQSIFAGSAMRPSPRWAPLGRPQRGRSLTDSSGAGGSEPRPIQQYAMALRCGHTDNAACYDKRSAGCCCPGRLLPAPSSSPDIETRASASWTHLEFCLLCGWRVAWRSPARPAQPASLLHLLCWFAGAVTIVCWRWPVLASSGAGPSPVVASVDD